MKAIMITSANKNALEVQYNMEPGYLQLSSGMFVVAGDGNRMIEGVLTRTILNAEYRRTGRQLNNGYFEVMPKTGITVIPEFSN